MKITVKNYSINQTFELDVEPTTKLEDLKAIVQVYSGIEIKDQALYFQGIKLTSDLKVLKDYGIQDKSILEVRKVISIQQLINQEKIISNPFYLEAQKFIDHYNQNQYELHALSEDDPILFDAIISNNIDYVASIIKERKEEYHRKQLEELKEIQNLEENPLDIENQKKIEQRLKNQLINENIKYASEENPDLFAQVSMLYVNISINKVKLIAFIDSGAQSTIMSAACAEKCGLSKLIDSRFKGTAIGVGTAQILGRIHEAPVEIGGNFITCSFTILDESSISADILFGLDNLKRLQCVIDLVDNELHLQRGKVKVKFLNEQEIEANPALKEIRKKNK